MLLRGRRHWQRGHRGFSIRAPCRISRAANFSPEFSRRTVKRVVHDTHIQKVVVGTNSSPRGPLQHSILRQLQSVGDRATPRRVQIVDANRLRLPLSHDLQNNLATRTRVRLNIPSHYTSPLLDNALEESRQFFCARIRIRANEAKVVEHHGRDRLDPARTEHSLFYLFEDKKGTRSTKT